jgi:hypothetical protein
MSQPVIGDDAYVTVPHPTAEAPPAVPPHPLAVFLWIPLATDDAGMCVLHHNITVPSDGMHCPSRMPVPRRDGCDLSWVVYGYIVATGHVWLSDVTDSDGQRSTLPFASVWPAIGIVPHRRLRAAAEAFLARFR